MLKSNLHTIVWTNLQDGFSFLALFVSRLSAMLSTWSLHSPLPTFWILHASLISLLYNVCPVMFLSDRLACYGFYSVRVLRMFDISLIYFSYWYVCFSIWYLSSFSFFFAWDCNSISKFLLLVIFIPSSLPASHSGCKQRVSIFLVLSI